MSSGEIMGQIQYCQLQISACEEKIRLKKEEIQEQENAQRMFNRDRTNYENELSALYKCSQAVAARVETVNIARKYHNVASEYFSKQSAELARLETIQCNMRTAIQKNYSELDAMTRELSSLKSQLESLNASYHAAVQREAEEAAAAAALAAANAARGGK